MAGKAQQPLQMMPWVQDTVTEQVTGELRQEGLGLPARASAHQVGLGESC